MSRDLTVGLHSLNFTYQKIASSNTSRLEAHVLRLFQIAYNLFFLLFGSKVRKVVMGHMTCSGRNQARKSGENRYSFSIPLWFALRHHFLWKNEAIYHVSR